MLSIRGPCLCSKIGGSQQAGAAVALLWLQCRVHGRRFLNCTPLQAPWRCQVKDVSLAQVQRQPVPCKANKQLSAATREAVMQLFLYMHNPYYPTGINTRDVRM